MASLISRRDWLRHTGLAVAGLALPRATGRAGAARVGRLVVVRLRGGADALSLVVPWRHRRYYALRPTIGIPRPGSGPHAAIDLDRAFGLHPCLAPLVPLYRDGRLGIVQGCGYPDDVRTHLLADERLDALLRSVGDAGPAPVESVCVSAGDYPSSPLGFALAGIARRVNGGHDGRLFVAESRGWDHHAGQGDLYGPLAESADDLARGLAAFVADLGNRLAETTIVTLSEFGRSAAENDHGGTEHGHAMAMFVIGGGVKRGRLEGVWPGLDRHRRGTHEGLVVTTQVARVLAALQGFSAPPVFA